MLGHMRRRLGSELAISLQGQHLRLVPGGSLAHVPQDGLAEAVATWHEGMELCLERVPPPGCGDDHVTAVNLTRPIPNCIDTEVRACSHARYMAAAWSLESLPTASDAEGASLGPRPPPRPTAHHSRLTPHASRLTATTATTAYGSRLAPRHWPLIYGCACTRA